MSFPLSLRVWPLHEESIDSLESLVKRINEERDHFRNVTEDGLLKEIEDAEIITTADEAASPEAENTQDTEKRRKELYNAREEMLKFVRQAQNEALTALDFMSLLISREAPRQADLSMSPFLKQTIPGGTLSFDNTQASNPTAVQDESDKNVSMGWNFQSLNSAADRLLDSATRLEEEMTKEARYWEGILSVSEKGWSVCRMPRESHTVGVRFGFSESAPLFGAQGFAALRPDAEGNIILDQGLASNPSCIRVRFFKDGKILGTSYVPSLKNIDEAPLETLIHQARDRLFEAELFQEMTREARSLLSYGVNIVDNEIRVPARFHQLEPDAIALQHPHEMRIDQVSLAGSLGDPGGAETHQFANAVATALRILLTYAYRRKFRLRSQPPPPLSNEKRIPPIQSILRPIICHFLHEDALENLQAATDDIVHCLQSAGLHATLNISASPLNALFQKRSTMTSMEAIVATLSAPLRTRIALDLPVIGLYTIDINTHLSPPTSGISYKVTLPASMQSANSPSMVEFEEFSEMQHHLTSVACAAVARYIASLGGNWTLEDSGSDLRKVFTSVKRIKRMLVAYHNGRLGLFESWEGEAASVLGVWQAKEHEKQRSLASVVEQASEP